MEIQMNWEAIGAIGEVAGAAGVIITLAYLAVQIRQNTRAARASNYESVLNGLRDFHALIARDGELANIYMRGSADLALLKPPELVHFTMLLYNVFTNFGVALHLYEQGMIQRQLLRVFEGGLVAILDRPGVLAWWMTDDAKLMWIWDYIERQRAA